jgi:hypothetical protein
VSICWKILSKNFFWNNNLRYFPVKKDELFENLWVHELKCPRAQVQCSTIKLHCSWYKLKRHWQTGLSTNPGLETQTSTLYFKDNNDWIHYIQLCGPTATLALRILTAKLLSAKFGRQISSLSIFCFKMLLQTAIV